MTKKDKTIFVIKSILELSVFILLVLTIVYLIKSENGVLSKITEGDAREKLDVAIKTFSSTEGMKLETAIRSIEGLDNLEINEETGEYNIKIDGQDFLVVSKEILNGGEVANNIEKNELINDVNIIAENNLINDINNIKYYEKNAESNKKMTAEGKEVTSDGKEK